MGFRKSTPSDSTPVLTTTFATIYGWFRAMPEVLVHRKLQTSGSLALPIALCCRFGQRGSTEALPQHAFALHDLSAPSAIFFSAVGIIFAQSSLDTYGTSDFRAWFAIVPSRL